MTISRWHSKTLRILTALLLFATLVYIIDRGFFAFGKGRWIDAQFFYVAGRCWLNHDLPYNFELFNWHWQDVFETQAISSFVYPPSLAFLAIPLGLFPWDIAKWVLNAINLLAFLGVWFFTFRLTVTHPHVNSRSLKPWIFLIFSGFISAIPSVLYIGQMGLIALCGILGSFYAWQYRQSWLFGIFFVLSTFKPQISFIPLVYLLAIADRRFLLPSLLFATFAMLSPLLGQSGAFLDIPHQLVESYRIHLALPFNDRSNYVSLPALFGKTELSSLAIAAGLVVALSVALALAYLYKRNCSRGASQSFKQPTLDNVQADPVRHLQILLALVAALIPIQKYDLVVYIPLLGTLPILVERHQILPLLAMILAVARIDNLETIVGIAFGENVSPIVDFLVNGMTGAIFFFVFIGWMRETWIASSRKPVH
ncbi:MAG TPA: DUF2029 domain-containing protein [Oscillatoriales cyanobacterium M59_W2019_021]|nr:MAG: DUF2029 domain-containing protein [Cyanobacteria bacterium J055]HIK31301.1 DUF2029 domain-containing protein [Oscillatoriales cyanobacterium M4454_W2019_049]HIK51841.1 DUF2029 domain-containing protein [Oscillatoriales cyanobacterium M59_W2019_021]